MIGPPSLQAMDGAQGARIWMASEATDMRCGFDRLAERVRAVIGENPQSGHLFGWCPYPTSASNVAGANNLRTLNFTVGCSNQWLCPAGGFVKGH